MRAASIKCPHCQKDIIVRDSNQSADLGTADPENVKKIFAETEKMFDDIAKGFKKIFHPSLWK